MIACDRMISIREKEAHLQLQRQELADKEFIFESERSAIVLMRQKSCTHFVVFVQLSEMSDRYLSAESLMSEAHNLQVSCTFNCHARSGSLHCCIFFRMTALKIRSRPRELLQLLRPQI
jgi:hypothetical protein